LRKDRKLEYSKASVPLSFFTTKRVFYLPSSFRKGDDIEAVLYFERESATSTALLLNKAIIDGVAIKVQPYTEAKLIEHAEEESLREQINLEKQNPDQPSQLSAEQLSAPLVDVHHAEPENITDRPGDRVRQNEFYSLLFDLIFLNL
jgi:hypothetical protein